MRRSKKFKIVHICVSALAIGEGLNADDPENSSSRKRQRLHEEDEEKDEENQSSECSKRVNLV